MDYAKVTKIHIPQSAKRYSHPPEEHALYKDGNGELLKVIADITPLPKTAAPLLFANKRAVNHATWSNLPK